MANLRRAGNEVKVRTVFVSVILALIGALIIAVSVIQELRHKWEFGNPILRELGIVVFSVFTVSLLYERTMAERHFKAFSDLLRAEIADANKNAAACNDLGIIEIFSNRSALFSRYPFGECLNALGKGGLARFVALSLFHVMNKYQDIQGALRAGSNIELCLITPKLSAVAVSTLPDLQIQDIQAAVEVFKKQLAGWVTDEKPPGRLEVRYHGSLVPESFTRFSSTGLQVAFWELSFGRDLNDKRTIVVDPSKTLGKDLQKRFDFVFQGAQTVFLYEHYELRMNALGPLGTVEAAPSS